MKAAGLFISFLISSAFSLTLPGVANYMLTYNSSENREALESAQKNITDGPLLEFIDEAKSIAVSSQTDDESPMEHIKLEASEVSGIKDIEGAERYVSADRKSSDNDRLEPDRELRIKVPVDSFGETPVLPKLALFEPDALWSLSSKSKPKPLKTTVGSGVKTVYVQATKTVKQKPVCITFYGLKPACDEPGSYHQESCGFKHLESEGAYEQYEPPQLNRDGGIPGSNKPSEPSLSSPFLTHPRVSENTGETSLDEPSDDINDDEYSDAAFRVRTKGKSKDLLSMKSFAHKDDNKILPNKAKPGVEIITKTIYSIQVLQEEGATATLVLENCVPSNLHIPFCDSIRPYHVSEMAANYFPLPRPDIHGTFPVDYHVDNMQTPLTTLNLFSPNMISHKPVLPELTNQKAPLQKFLPTSFLQRYSGIHDRLLNFRHSLSSAAYGGFHKVRHQATLATNIAANLANTVHSHLHHHNTKKNGSKVSSNTYTKEPTGETLPTTSNGNIKPVKEEQQEGTTPQLRLEEILATKKTV